MPMRDPCTPVGITTVDTNDITRAPLDLVALSLPGGQTAGDPSDVVVARATEQ
jgi:hypothetical protein